MVSGVNLVSLSVGVQVMNALLLPIVLGFLYLLARRLPRPYRLQGAYAAVVGTVIATTVIFAVYSGLSGLWAKPQSALSALARYIGRNVGRLGARYIHVRHLGMRQQQE